MTKIHYIGLTGVCQGAKNFTTAIKIIFMDSGLRGGMIEASLTEESAYEIFPRSLKYCSNCAGVNEMAFSGSLRNVEMIA